MDRRIKSGGDECTLSAGAVMLILGVHSGNHDAGAVLADEYRILAAVAQERMTRRKTDGGRMPVEAIAECLAIAGVGLQDVDAVVLGRGAFLSRYFTHLRGGRAAEQAVRRLLGREKHKSMEREARRYACLDSLSMFDRARFLADYGFRADADLAFYNHHRSHAMATLFHTDWDDALLYTADGGGDNVQYSHRILRDGELATLYGGDEGLLLPPNVDSLGLVYGFATQALGFRINRHEGKLTGLAALGQPVLKDRLAAHFRVDGEGRIQSDFPDYPALRQFVLDWAAGQKREDVAASAQALAEMKEKIKILQNEVEILRTESVQKDKALSKERLEHQNAFYARDAIRAEQNKHMAAEKAKKAQVAQLAAETDNLNSLINGIEKEMLKLKKHYEQAVEERNYTGIQLIDRNDELCILYEKSNMQQVYIYRPTMVLLNAHLQGP